MGQTVIMDETTDVFSSDTGEILQTVKHRVHKSSIEPTDEYIKVSRYLNLIYAYNGIPLSMVPISLIFAQRMQYRTNILYLLKGDKQEIADMLCVKINMIDKLIMQAKQYDIIRPTGDRGKYEVNSFLFSTGSIVETRNLQAQFDLDHDTYRVQADQRNAITGDVVRKCVVNRKDKTQIPGQMSLPGTTDTTTDNTPSI